MRTIIVCVILAALIAHWLNVSFWWGLGILIGTPIAVGIFLAMLKEILSGIASFGSARSDQKTDTPLGRPSVGIRKPSDLRRIEHYGYLAILARDTFREGRKLLGYEKPLESEPTESSPNVPSFSGRQTHALAGHPPGEGTFGSARIWIQYLSGDDEITQRDIQPRTYSIRNDPYSFEPAMYIQAYCELRQDMRTFIVDRIQAAYDPESGQQIPDVEGYLLSRSIKWQAEKARKRRSPNEWKDYEQNMKALGTFTMGIRDAGGSISCKAEDVRIPLACKYMSSKGEVSEREVLVTGFTCQWHDNTTSVLTSVGVLRSQSPRGMMNAYRILSAYDPETGEIITDLFAYLRERSGTKFRWMDDFRSREI